MVVYINLKFIAVTTLSQYNAYLNKYKLFCLKMYDMFPPDIDHRQGSIAAFLYNSALSSKRPQSLIKMIWASITHYYDAIDINVRCIDLTHYMHALINHGTTVPQGRTLIPPIQPILDLFRGWQCNENLSIEKLRMKCICLLCLTAMCRPYTTYP